MAKTRGEVKMNMNSGSKMIMLTAILAEEVAPNRVEWRKIIHVVNPAYLG